MPLSRLPDEAPRPALGGALVLAAAAAVWIAQAAVGVAIVLHTQRDLLVGCEVDGHYERAAYLRCGDIVLFEQNTQYWPWLHPWLTAQLATLVGDTYLAGRLISVAAMATLTAVVFATAWRQWRSLAAAIVAAIVIGTTPQLLYYGTLVSTDMLAVSVTTLAIPFALAVLRGERVGLNASVAGVVCALGAQVRYQAFPWAFVLGVVLALTATRPHRLRAAVGFTAGLGGALALLAHTRWASHGDFAGVRAAWAAGDRQVPWEMSIRELLASYAHSAALVAWHVDFLPVLGLVALALRGLKPGRPRAEALVLLVPTVAQFLAVGWFPSLRSPELRRVFLPVLPIAALGSAVLWRWALTLGRPRAWVMAGLVVIFLPLTANQVLAEFPLRGVFGAQGNPLKLVPYDLYPRQWDLARDARADELGPSRESLRRLLQDVDLGCAPGLTNSAIGDTVLPVPIPCRADIQACAADRGLDNAAIDALLAATRSSLPVRWALEERALDRFWADPSQPVGPQHDLTLTLRVSDAHFRLYELVSAGGAPDAPATPIAPLPEATDANRSCPP